MKKEVSPAVIVTVIAVVVVGVAAFFLIGGGGGGEPVKIDPTKIDTKDANPVRRGEPGYQERTTDAPSN